MNLLSRFKLNLSLSILIGKLFILAFILFQQHGYTFVFPQTLLFILTELPLFALFLSFFIKYLAQETESRNLNKGSESIPAVYGSFIHSINFVYTLSVILVLNFMPAGTEKESDPGSEYTDENTLNIIRYLLTIEFVFGIYLGYIIQDVFLKLVKKSDNEELINMVKQIKETLKVKDDLKLLPYHKLLEIRQEIARGHIEEAIKSLINCIEQSNTSIEFLNQVYGLSFRYHHFKRQNRIGNVNDSITLNQVANGLLELIDEVKEQWPN